MIPYKTAIIRVFSGTGNSHRVAAWLAEVARGRGVEVSNEGIGPEVRKSGSPEVENSESPDSGAGNEKTLLALVFPTHAFTAPWRVVRYACGLPRGNGAHAVVVATRAGLKFGPVFTPGMEGTGAYLIALILRLKGYRIRGVCGVDMPSNWIASHWGLHRSTAEPIVARSRRVATRFGQRVLDGGRAFPIGGMVELLLGLVLAPISFLYLIQGRFFLAKLFFADNRCTGCGLCAASCPVQAITMWGKRPYWSFACESCMRCMAFCPTKAVESGHSLGILYFLLTAPLFVWGMNELVTHFPSLAWALDPENSTWIFILANWAFSLIALGLAYLVLTVLLRVRAINALFAYTTLTRYWRRYHEPDTVVKDLVPPKAG
jgi:ferredoxin